MRTAHHYPAVERPGVASPKITGEVTGEVAGEVTGEVAAVVTEEIRRLVHVLQAEMKRSELQAALGLRHEDHFRDVYLVPALAAGLVEMTHPDKPTSSKQRYRLTVRGQALRRKDLAENNFPNSEP